MKVEVVNGSTDVIDDTDIQQAFWVATVADIKQYHVLLRYEGFESDPTADFWFDLRSKNIHPVGWCAKRNKLLIPPQGTCKLSSFNFSCSLTRNITSHSMKNLAFRLLRWKMIILIILTTLLIYVSFEKLGRMYFLSLGVKGLICCKWNHEWVRWLWINQLLIKYTTPRETSVNLLLNANATLPHPCCAFSSRRQLLQLARLPLQVPVWSQDFLCRVSSAGGLRNRKLTSVQNRQLETNEALFQVWLLVRRWSEVLHFYIASYECAYDRICSRAHYNDQITPNGPKAYKAAFGRMGDGKGRKLSDLQRLGSKRVK